MKIDFRRQFVDFAGNPLMDEGKPIVLKIVVVNALIASSPNDSVIDGAEKVRRYELASRIYKAENGVVDLVSEDIALCKQLVGKFYTTIVVGQALPMLETSAD